MPATPGSTPASGSRADTVARAPLPPIARALSRSEWLLVSSGWLLLGLSSAGTLTDRARQAGIAIVYRDYLVMQVADWVAWMVVLWPLFAALDATPVAAPLAARRRAAHALARAVAWVAATAAHVALDYSLLRALARPLGLGDEIWRLGAATPAGMFSEDLLNVVLAFAVYALLRRVHRRRVELVRAADLERSLLRARLHALDLELQPHFLFNSLNAITALVRSEPQQAERMLITLGDLLRVTLGRTGREVTVEEELDHLDLYLDLQRSRFGDRVDVRVEVDAEVLPACVPAMILQPLVENALTHGLAPKVTAGRLEVSVARRADSVVLRVSDDGVGLPAAGARERTGVGNTRERLRGLYGDAHEFTLAAGAGGGVVSEIRLPFRTAPTRTAEFQVGALHAPTADATADATAAARSLARARDARGAAR